MHLNDEAVLSTALRMCARRKEIVVAIKCGLGLLSRKACGVVHPNLNFGIVGLAYANASGALIPPRHRHETFMKTKVHKLRRPKRSCKVKACLISNQGT